MSEAVSTSVPTATSILKRRTRTRLLAAAGAAAMACAALMGAAPGAQARPSNCVQLQASIQSYAVDWTNDVARGNYDLAEADGHLMQAALIAYRGFGC